MVPPSPPPLLLSPLHIIIHSYIHDTEENHEAFQGENIYNKTERSRRGLIGHVLESTSRG